MIYAPISDGDPNLAVNDLAPDRISVDTGNEGSMSFKFVVIICRSSMFHRFSE